MTFSNLLDPFVPLARCSAGKIDNALAKDDLEAVGLPKGGVADVLDATDGADGQSHNLLSPHSLFVLRRGADAARS